MGHLNIGAWDCFDKQFKIKNCFLPKNSHKTDKIILPFPPPPAVCLRMHAAARRHDSIIFPFWLLKRSKLFFLLLQVTSETEFVVLRFQFILFL